MLQALLRCWQYKQLQGTLSQAGTEHGTVQ